MPVTVIYPKVSLDSASGKISQWLVAEGDAVQQGQILFESENDKAAAEARFPANGTINAIGAALPPTNPSPFLAPTHGGITTPPPPQQPWVQRIGPTPLAMTQTQPMAQSAPATP